MNSHNLTKKVDELFHTDQNILKKEIPLIKKLGSFFVFSYTISLYKNVSYIHIIEYIQEELVEQYSINNYRDNGDIRLNIDSENIKRYTIRQYLKKYFKYTSEDVNLLFEKIIFKYKM